MRRFSGGFTIVELVLVLLLVGILAAIAAPRFFDTKAFRAAGLVGEVASAIRYAQRVAVASRCRIQTTVNQNVTDGGGTQYVVYALHYLDCVASPPERVGRPQPKAGNTEFFESDAQGVALAGSFQLVFDAQGMPVGLATPATVQIGSHQLVVEPGSGLVHVD